MNLSEFIMMASLKGRVIEHKELDVHNHGREYFLLKVRARGYLATIHYSKLNDVLEIELPAKLEDFKPPYPVNDRASLEQIVEAIIPSN